jgi:hypothetical protein
MRQHPSDASTGHARKPEHAPQEHPSIEHLDGFMRGELTAAERRRIVRHLLTGCADCKRVTGHLWSLGEPAFAEILAHPRAERAASPDREPAGAPGRQVRGRLSE